jgi:hypothetical protein
MQLMKKTTEGNCSQRHLADQTLWELLARVDSDLAEQARAEGCLQCGGKLHRADYERKPRGGPTWEWRDSFCCGREGCRRRRTPPSVRFLGRRVYVGFVVVLVAAMVHGLKAARVEVIRERLGIDRRTLERWRQWWLGRFTGGRFWKAARARFMPPVSEGTLPWSLCARFGAERRDGLARLLEFLAPITIGSDLAM